MDQEESDGYQKAKAILAEAFAGRADRLDPDRPATTVMDAIQAALTEEFGTDKAADIAFHMADWNSDAAFILALHLFPERFTKAEIEDGIEPNAEAIASLAAWKASQKTPADVRYGELSYAWWSGQGRSLKRHVSKFIGEVEFNGDWAMFDGRKVKLSGNNYEGFKTLARA